MSSLLDAPASLAGDAATLDQEFSFASADFERVRKLIYQRAGISLHDGKRAMVYSRLSRRLRETGHRSFSDYLKWLEGATGIAADQEWQEFINCLTTNLTSFFREDHHFHALAEALKGLTNRSPRIWCNAASTGEEPYSITMVLNEVPRAQQRRAPAGHRHRHQGAGHRATRRLPGRFARPLAGTPEEALHARHGQQRGLHPRQARDEQVDRLPAVQPDEHPLVARRAVRHGVLP
jgi:hypothetical protein